MHFPPSRRPESYTSNKNRHPALMNQVIGRGNTTDSFNPIYPMNKFVCNITTDELFSVACIFPGVGSDSFLLVYGCGSDNRACRLDREDDDRAFRLLYRRSTMCRYRVLVEVTMRDGGEDLNTFLRKARFLESGGLRPAASGGWVESTEGDRTA